MIINIRGLSGSGKSTAVKNIMALYTHKEPIHFGKRSDPMGYKLSADGINSLVVLGPYENEFTVSGCDVISYQGQVQVLLQHYTSLGYDCMYESMNLSDNASLPMWAVALGAVAVLYLDISATRAAAQRVARSQAKDPKKVLKTANGIKDPNNLERVFVALSAVDGIECQRVSYANVVESAHALLSNQPIREILADNICELSDKFMCAGMGVSRKAKSAAKNTLFAW